MRNFIGTIGLLLLPLLTSCASYQWQKPGLTQQEFSRDAYECERDARQGAYYGTGWVADLNFQSFQERCMYAKGYQKVKAN